MLRRFAVALSASLLFAVCAGACGSNKDDDSSAAAGSVQVVASTNVYGDIVEQIAGTHAKVTSIISDPSADPHSYEANTQTQLALSKADIVVENGGGYDDFVDTLLKTAKNSDATVLNAVDISGIKAADGEELNEHVWYNFDAMDKLTDRLVTALSKADPDEADGFSSRGDSFKQKLAAMQATEAALKTAHAGDGVAITEPVPLYLLAACGLTNKTPGEFSEAIEEGTDVPPTVLRETLDLFKTHAVKLLAYNEQTTGPETEQVLAAAKDNGVAVVPFTETLPDGKNYVTWMTANLDALQAALG